MPGITMQPLKHEDLDAQFDSILRRYRDSKSSRIKEREKKKGRARDFMNDMLNLFERIERLRLFVNNDGAKKVLVHFTKKLGNLNNRNSKKPRIA